jgi:hypothetical protein
MRGVSQANSKWTTHVPLAASHLTSEERELSRTVTWNHDLAVECAQAIDRYKNLDRVKEIFPASFSAAHLMLERLTFQETVYKVKSRFSPVEMVRLSYIHGPTFATKWKQAWEQSRFKWLGIVPWQDPEHNAFCDAIDFSKGPEGVWNHRFFIFWDEECDDYKYSLDSPVQAEEKALESLTSWAMKMSDKYLKEEDFGDEIDHLLESLPVSSNAFLGTRESKTQEWATEFYGLYSAKEEPNLRGLQSKAPKRPGETRDITIPSPGVLRACKRLNRPLKESIKRLQTCPFGKNREACISEMEKHDVLPYHYMRDFRKIGLTLPKSVLRAFLEGFFYKYPEFKAQIIEFFCNTELLVNVGTHDEWFKTYSGFHMGFFNEGLTWIQYVVHAIACERMAKDGPRIRFTAFNDDSLISCSNYQRLSLYATVDQDLWDELAVPLSYNKCGLAKDAFIYLEEIYKDGVRYSKEFLYSLGIIGAKNCVNIVHAKDYVNAITQSMSEWGICPMLAIEEVVRYWGIEFYETEYKKPYLFGGWFTPREEGLDSSLAYYHGTRDEDKAYKAVTSAKVKPKEVSTGKGWSYLAKTLDLSLFGEIPPNLDLITGSSLHFWNEETAKRSYNRLAQDGKALMRYYFRAYTARKAIFSRKLTESILDDWHYKHPNSILHHHTVRYYTDDGDKMDQEAPTVAHKKPSRLGLQTLVAEGIIRSGRVKVVPLPRTIHELCLAGFLYSIPETKLPSSGYVHESILLGNDVAYNRYWKQTGRFPVSGRRTVLSQDILFAASKQIPWQIAVWLREIGQLDSWERYIFLKSEKPEESEPNIGVDEPESSSNPQFKGSDSQDREKLILEIMKAADPEWGCELPLSGPVEVCFQAFKDQFLSPEEQTMFLEGLVRAPRTAVEVRLDAIGSPIPSEEGEAAGIWSDDDGDYGEAFGCLFGE